MFDFVRASAFIIALGAASLAMPAMAQTVGVPSAGGLVAVGIDDSVTQVGTTVRAVNDRLSQFSLSLRATTATLTVRPVVYPVTGGVIGSTPLWTGSNLTVSSTAFSDYAFSPALTVAPGDDYALVVEQQTAGEAGEIEWVFSDDYADGVPIFYDTVTADWVENPSQDAVFAATFAPAPAPVPTMAEWAMIALTALLAVFGAALLNPRPRHKA